METYFESPVGRLWRYLHVALAIGVFSLAPVSLQAEGYARFGSNPAVFTWAGAGASFTNGTFARFDVAAGADTSEIFRSADGYRTVPGWSGSLVPRFWWVFATGFDGTRLSYATGSGYVLRFSADSAGKSVGTPSALTLGGLIVEPGAAGITLGGTGANVARLTLGADEAQSSGCLSVGESFTIAGAVDRVLGRVELDVAQGKVLTVTSIAVPGATDNPSVSPVLKFSGAGQLSGKVTAANNAVLDFSAQAVSRSTPFLAGVLTLGRMTRLVLPASVEPDVAYPLCGGTLTAASGCYALARGEGDFFLANLVFASGAVSYTAAEVNRATLDGDLAWSSLAWESGAYQAGLPIELNLSRDVVLTADVESVSAPALLVSGGHRLTLVNREGAVFDKVFLGRGSACEIVIDSQSAGFSKALSVASGLPYETVVAGSADPAEPARWTNQTLSVAGRLTTRGFLSVDPSRIALSSGAVLTVGSGRLNLQGAGTWTGATFVLGGELAFGAEKWTAAAGSSILFRDGGAVVATGGNGATFDLTGATFVRVCAEADAVLSAGLSTKTNALAIRAERASSLTVAKAAEKSVADIATLTGAGALAILSSNDVSGAAFRLRDVSAFDGRLEVRDTRASVLLGDAALAAESAIVVPGGFRLDSNRDWAATVVRFGSVLSVNGAIGDALFRVLGDDVNFDSVSVLLTGADGGEIVCGLGVDSVTRQMYFVPIPAPPRFDVTDVSFDYGADFTNGTVRVTIDNYWPGYEFEGFVNAEFYVYDSAGRLVGYGSSNLSSNGVCEVGHVVLPNGRGRDFRCEVKVRSINSKTGEEALLYDSSKPVPAVQWRGNWFHEDASTFPAATGPTAYGTWSYQTEDAHVEGGQIEINTSASLDRRVVFEPDQDCTNDFVTVRTQMRLDGAWDTNAIPSIGSSDLRMAGLTLVSADDVHYAYAVWLPEEHRFEIVYGNEPADVTAVVDLEVSFNYRTGLVGYSVNGSALTNESGRSYFPLPEIYRQPGRAMAYRGCGSVVALAGNRYNAAIAAVGKGGVTNEFESLDEAIAAAKSAGVTNVTLLWDAAWHPVDPVLGETIAFDRNGHRLLIDEGCLETMRRKGYRIRENADGSFTVDVIVFELSYDANGAESGEMGVQNFSVTNRVLDLLPNRFVRNGFDFTAWNAAADGSGPTNWTDRARIDLTPFGCTNVTLFAQWKVSVLTLTIEPADEFVYVESVMTNGAPSLAARYYQADAAKGTGRVEIPVESGSDVIVRFSTDIEKQLTYYAAETNMAKSVTWPYIDLPKVVSPYSPLPPDQLAWAIKHDIPLEEVAASPYAQASCDLDLDHLLTAGSIIAFTAFTSLSDGCSFYISVDGKPLTEEAKIAPMIRVCRNFAEGWKTPAADKVSVGADGKVSVQTGDPISLFKIVIP